MSVIWPWDTNRWIDIRSRLSVPIKSYVELESTIAAIHRGKNIPPRTLNNLFSEYHSTAHGIPMEKIIGEIIPMMQTQVCNAPAIFKNKIPLLLANKPGNIVLTRLQAAVIIFCIFFDLLNYDYIMHSVSTNDAPSIDINDFSQPSFSDGFSNQNIFAFSCLINYFDRVYENLKNTQQTTHSTHQTYTQQIIIIKRNVLFNNVLKDERYLQLPLADISLGESNSPGNIDDSPAKIHSVYCTEYIGKNFLERSITQEELTMLIRPELITAIVFCQRLNANESITVFGAEKISQYNGHGTSITFAGNYLDSVPISAPISAPIKHNNTTDGPSQVMMAKCAAAFLDASSKTSSKSQFIDDFDRDILKAYCAFSSVLNHDFVAAGNWIYGFNGGNIQIKFIQQLIGATLAGHNLIYYSRVKEFEDEIIKLADWINDQNLTVGGLLHKLDKLISDSYSGPNSRLNNLDVFKCLIDLY